MTARLRMALVVLAAAALAAAASGARAQAPVRGGAPIATVGTERIGADELERAFREGLDLYRARNGEDLNPQLEPLVRRQILENLIRQRLLALEARRRGITVSEADAEAELKKDPVFHEAGRFSENRYQALRAANPEAYRRSIAGIKATLAARRAGQQMERDVRVDDAPIRARLERELTLAGYDALALRGNEVDGSHPEPTEAEVLAHYRQNADRYRRPLQALLSVVLVDRPALADSMGRTDAGVRAWQQSLRTRADSARAALRAGTPLEAIGLLYGGVRAGQAMSRDRLPDFWRGTPREIEAVFSASPGTILPEPVGAARGWALVRVDAVVPARVAPLRDVAKEIRRTLREAARRAGEDRDLTAIHAGLRDSLRQDGVRLRYAFADTLSFRPAEPALQDLERFYRAHLADYSSYDRTSGQVTETPLAAVRDNVRARWLRVRRVEMARLAADRLREAWARGRRDAALERTMTRVRDVGVIPLSLQPESGPVGEAISHELSRRPGQTGTSVVPAAGGFAVVQVTEVVRGFTPTPEQARDLLLPRLAARREAALQDSARALYERDTSLFRAPVTMHFTRMFVEPPPVLAVPLTRAEVERHFRANISQYSVEEVVRVRHILVSPDRPGTEADAAARREAEDLLRRVRAGEDFARLAAEHSDDPATAGEGGDVGVFRRGMMRPEFERASFAMRPGDVTGPVRTEAGYHVIECLEYQAPVIHPLGKIYANVAHDAALKKAQRLAVARADSLRRTMRTVADAKAVGEKLGLFVAPTDHPLGTADQYPKELVAYMRTLERLEPGELHPAVQFYEGNGAAITWVDQISRERRKDWVTARPQAAQRHRTQRTRSLLLAKMAELDSMAAAGWSYDSLATLWGGWERTSEATKGGEIRGLGGRPILDSLVFGGERPPALATGRLSSWVEFPGGFARIRVAGRTPPDPDVLARRTELRAKIERWHKLNAWFAALEARHPVRIHDGELRAIVLPEPAEES